MNNLDIGLAFVEGLALVVSPCILPVLPLVLSASVTGGRGRPYGIIVGFILAFSAFALLSRKLVTLLGLDLDVIKYVSLALLTIFGLVLLSETLSNKFAQWTQRFASAGASFSSNNEGGFVSGIGIGALIGVVWTPCAGPVLAIVLVQVIRQETDIAGLFVILSFAFGAAIPMFIIALTGRSLMNRLSFLSHHAEGIRKGFGVLVLLTVAFLATGIDPQTVFSREASPVTKAMMTQESKNSSGLQNGLATPYPAPEFTGIEAWLNSNALTMASLKGKVVLIDFWTYSCINCVRTLPYITAWDQTYRDKGLVIIGVHSPEFEFEKKKSNVEAAIKKYGIAYPVAQDNRLDTWTAFQNRYWPAHYLIDRDGRVVYTHFGEGHYDVTENNIRTLLGVTGKADRKTEEPGFSSLQTPETYLGFERTEHFGSPQGLIRGKASRYEFPRFLPLNNWALNGEWKIEEQKSIAQSAGAALQLNFNARKVFLVLGSSTQEPMDVTVTLNGEPLKAASGKDVVDGKLTVTGHTLYELIDQKTFGNGLLELTSSAPGLEVYAFTFEG